MQWRCTSVGRLIPRLLQLDDGGALSLPDSHYVDGDSQRSNLWLTFQAE